MILSGRYIGYLPVSYAAGWVAIDRMRSLLPERFRLITDIETVTRKGGRPIAGQSGLSRFDERDAAISADEGILNVRPLSLGSQMANSDSMIAECENRSINFVMSGKSKPETETPDRLTLLGDELRALRQAQGLTPQALAETSGETTAVSVKANTPPGPRR